jgi:crossover junction endodeoxyribonuclease RuvC
LSGLPAYVIHHSDFHIDSLFEFRHSIFFPMLILGIDPGLQLTGYGLIDFTPAHSKLIDAGVIRLDAKTPLPDRLVELERELTELIRESRPQICAVEQLYAHYAHPRTAILMGHARGVILLAARKLSVPVEQFPANRVKQSVVGHGHASKTQVQRAIQLQFRLDEPPNPPDVADALAIALCCGRGRFTFAKKGSGRFIKPS